MRELYPAIEPHASGLMEVGDGHSVFWEECGNPQGKPVVFLHGGPGGGASARHRRLFDPAKYRILLLDQRGCGRSRPLASDPVVDMSANTTWHLVADLEQLRTERGIEKWQVFGGSWGSTLALAYAQKHPERVSELVLRGIFTLRKSEITWFYEGPAANIAPDTWAGFLGGLPEAMRVPGQLVENYAKLLFDEDPAVHQPAAVAWATWELGNLTVQPRPDLIAVAQDAVASTAFARIENHYFRHDGWLTPGQLIADAPRLAGIPTVIVQGRYDICTPAVTAWDLHQALPEAEFHIIEDAGHAFDEPGILDVLVTTTDKFADRS
ncbi:proline iminopeptidase [Kineosporia sp. NBRC 101677]|uniref:prolyl aminopeptidase n=1 Tax=Kineosporia sp. NBRC 101677 TaxID=3032197 RepID=UPI00249FCFB8|nr:prolyl aminopeptidase [Kineosporia sp. NBRC 101677]GLY18947.1 proline iminopeptidase [Kineosporia sp. NBRC 101677]